MLNEKNIFFSILSLILLLSLVFFFELRLSSDSKTYLNSSDQITSLRSIFTIQQPLYFMSYLIFKLINLFENFNFLFKIFNFTCFILIVIYSNKILTFHNVHLSNKYEILFFYLLFFLNFDMVQWTYYALTDLVLVASLLASIYYFLKKNILLVVLISSFALLIKPQSIFIFFILGYIIFLQKNYKHLTFFYLYFLFYLSLFIVTYIINILDIRVHLFDICYKIFFSKIINGIVIDDRIFIDYVNIFSIFKIYILRSFYLFSVFFKEYSMKHIIYNLFYFACLYLPLLVYFLKKIPFNKKFVNFILGCLFIVAIFLILSFIDYDLRYRIYLYPFLIMLSTYCFKKLYARKKFE